LWRIRTVKRGCLTTTQLDGSLWNCSFWVIWSARNLNSVPLIEHVPSSFALVKTSDSDSDLVYALLQVKMARQRLHSESCLIAILSIRAHTMLMYHIFKWCCNGVLCILRRLNLCYAYNHSCSFYFPSNVSHISLFLPFVCL
jgi:hypothetical protein